jgi:hypothetical protein
LSVPSPNNSKPPIHVPNPTARETHHASPKVASIKIVGPNLDRFRRKGNTEWCVSWSLFYPSDWLLNDLCFGEMVTFYWRDHFKHPTCIPCDR